MKTKKIFLTTLLISVFLLTGCQKKITGTISDLNKKNSETKIPSADKNLETWQAEEMDFSFQYPSDLRIYDCGKTIRLGFKKYDNTICWEGPKDTIPPITLMQEIGNLQSSLNWQENALNVSSKKQITVDSYPATRLAGTWKTGGMNPDLKGTKYEGIFIEKDSGYRVELSYLDAQKEKIDQEKYKEAFDAIVQSLQFDNSNTETINTQGWQTYNNTQYGFNFKYPSSWSIKENKLEGAQLEKIIKLSLGFSDNVHKLTTGMGEMTNLAGLIVSKGTLQEYRNVTNAPVAGTSRQTNLGKLQVNKEKRDLGDQTSYMINSPDQTYMITLNDYTNKFLDTYQPGEQQKIQDTIQKIFSSFEFTK